MRMSKVAFALWLACGIVVGAQPQPEVCPQAINLATELGTRFELDKPFPDDATTFEIEEQDPSRTVRYMRVRLRVTAPPALRWQLVARDNNGHAVEILTPADFASPTRERWTTRVPGPLTRFDRYVDSNDPDQLQVQFLEYIVMDTEAKRPYYSYQDPNSPKIYPLYDAKSPSSLDDRRLGDSTAFLMAASTGGQVWTCSGVIVAPGLLMTNWHCGGISPMLGSEYWSEEICKSVLIDVSWDDDVRSREFMCVGKPVANERLDVALLQIQPIDGTASVRPAILANAEPVLGNVKLIHHPEGLQKRIALNCSVKNVRVPGWRGDAGFDFTHDCDSEGGSSGAPIYEKSGKVIGLHHHGFKRNPKTCQAEDRLNKAVRMDEIIKWLDTTPALRAFKAQMRIQVP